MNKEKIGKIKFEPAKEIKRWTDEGVLCIEFQFPPLYDITQVIVSANTFGLVPAKIDKGKKHTFREFRLSSLVYSERKRRERKLSGQMAIVYALINPVDNKPFYIGSTKGDLHKRLWHHVRGRHRCNNHKKNAIIKGILDSKKQPLIVELCRCPVEFQFHEERRWIVGSKKLHKLSNIHNA